MGGIRTWLCCCCKEKEKEVVVPATVPQNYYGDPKQKSVEIEVQTEEFYSTIEEPEVLESSIEEKSSDQNTDSPWGVVIKELAERQESRECLYDSPLLNRLNTVGRVGPTPTAYKKSTKSESPEAGIFNEGYLRDSTSSSSESTPPVPVRRKKKTKKTAVDAHMSKSGMNNSISSISTDKSNSLHDISDIPPENKIILEDVYAVVVKRKLSENTSKDSHQFKEEKKEEYNKCILSPGVGESNSENKAELDKHESKMPHTESNGNSKSLSQSLENYISSPSSDLVSKENVSDESSKTLHSSESVKVTEVSNSEFGSKLISEEANLHVTKVMKSSSDINNKTAGPTVQSSSVSIATDTIESHSASAEEANLHVKKVMKSSSDTNNETAGPTVQSSSVSIATDTIESHSASAKEANLHVTKVMKSSSDINNETAGPTVQSSSVSIATDTIESLSASAEEANLHVTKVMKSSSDINNETAGPTVQSSSVSIATDTIQSHSASAEEANLHVTKVMKSSSDINNENAGPTVQSSSVSIATDTIESSSANNSDRVVLISESTKSADPLNSSYGGERTVNSEKINLYNPEVTLPSEINDPVELLDDHSSGKAFSTKVQTENNQLSITEDNNLDFKRKIDMEADNEHNSSISSSATDSFHSSVSGSCYSLTLNNIGGESDINTDLAINDNSSFTQASSDTDIEQNVEINQLPATDGTDEVILIKNIQNVDSSEKIEKKSELFSQSSVNPEEIEIKNTQYVPVYSETQSIVRDSNYYSRPLYAYNATSKASTMTVFNGTSTIVLSGEEVTNLAPVHNQRKDHKQGRLTRTDKLKSSELNNVVVSSSSSSSDTSSSENEGEEGVTAIPPGQL